MKKIYIIFLLLGITSMAQAPYERVVVEAGTRIPVGNLADIMDVSPEAGAWLRSRLGNGDMLDVGGSVFIPVSTGEFDYYTRDGVFQVKAKAVSGMAGFRFNKLYVVGFNRVLEWQSSFGYAWLTYNDEQAKYRDAIEYGDSANHSYTKGFSTFHVGQGVRYNIDNVGLQAVYNFTPYGMFSDYVPQNFGSHSFTLSIIYRQ
jgi:hypothetical protein